MAEPLHVLLSTPEKAVFEGDATALVLPAEEGEMGVLRDHVPMIGRVGSGLVKITQASKVTSFFACGGFFMISDNKVKILVDRACPPAELDLKAAEERLAKVAEMPTTNDMERRKAYAARRHAEGEIRTVTRREQQR
jgi:F-type H+-transporting ATPase subunit epsilon